MDLSSPQYLCSVYKKIIINLKCYLDHISTFLDFDECKFIGVKNTVPILSSTKFGIHFCKPNNIIELSRCYIGELTPEHVTAYFSYPVPCQCIPSIKYMELVCDIGDKFTYPKCMPDLNEDIPTGSVETTKMIQIQRIVQEYLDFYIYMSRKYCQMDCDDSNSESCCEKKYC